MADPGISSTRGPTDETALDYRSAFEFAPVAVALSRERRIVDCNLRMLAMFGAQRDDLVGHTFERLTEHGPRSTDELHAELAAIRERGYSIDDECVRRGVLSFGAPVFDSSGAVVAGIGMCINKAQLAPDGSDTHHEAVMRVARTLSTRLGAR